MTVDAILAEVCDRHGAVGAAAGWISGDATASAVWGAANAVTGVDATQDTVFAIGSVSKTYTATVVMKLVDDGSIDLDVPIADQVPDFALSDATAAATMTMRHILTHTSGIDGDIFEEFGRGDDCRRRLMAFLADVPQLTDVGEIYSYSNAAFAVAGHVMEQVTGKTYAELLASILGGPLGFERTVLFGDEAVRHRTAMGHFRLGGADPFLAPAFKLTHAQDPAGGIHTTIDELLSFARLHLDGGKTPSGKAVVSTASITEMQRPQLDRSLLTAMEGDVGLAWSLGTVDGESYLQHGGLTMGGNALLRLYPARATAIAVMCNTHGAPVCGEALNALQTEILQLTESEAPGGSEVDLSDPTRLVGSYRRHGVHVEIRSGGSPLEGSATGDGMMATLLAQALPAWTPLKHIGNDRFVGPQPATQVAFFGEQDGKARFCAVGGRLLRRVD